MARLPKKESNLEFRRLVRRVADTANATIPAGGSTNQILSKASNADYDTQWVNAPTGGGGGGSGNSYMPGGW